MSLQKALKLLRLEQGLTQEDLAKRLNKAFVTVNRWENGRTFPTRTAAKSILNFAKASNASEDCISYLNDVLIPDCKRGRSAGEYGFPDIERDFLFQLADESSNGLYVIDAKTHQLLYANRMAEQIAARDLKESGVQAGERAFASQTDRRCYHFFGNLEQPCDFCPLPHLALAAFSDSFVKIPGNGRSYHIRAKRAELKGNQVYVIYLTDLTTEFQERQALYETTKDIPVAIGFYHLYLTGYYQLVFCNEMLTQLLAIGKAGNLSSIKSADSAIHPEDRSRLVAEVKHSIAKKEIISITIRMRANDGVYRPFCLTGRLLQKDREKFTFSCVFLPESNG